jgi:hypothetical protein
MTAKRPVRHLPLTIPKRHAPADSTGNRAAPRRSFPLRGGSCEPARSRGHPAKPEAAGRPGPQEARRKRSERLRGFTPVRTARFRWGRAGGTRSGGCWIRTNVGVSRQVYSLLPLATRATLRTRAGEGTRTPNHLFTKQVLCRLSYASTGHPRIRRRCADWAGHRGGSTRRHVMKALIPH